VRVLELGGGHRLGLAPQVAVVVLVVGLASVMAIEPTRQLLEQRSRIAGMSEDLRTIRRANEQLESRVARLQDPDYLEQEAREGGLVRPGETSVIVMPPPESEEDPARDKERAVTNKPMDEPTFVESLQAFLGLN
jgi:cell division protein FtsB